MGDTTMGNWCTAGPPVEEAPAIEEKTPILPPIVEEVTELNESLEEQAERQFNCIYAWFVKHVERHCIARWLGGVGFECLARHRKPIFRFAGVMVFAAIVLTSIAAVTFESEGATNVTTKGHMYVGLSGILSVISK